MALSYIPPKIIVGYQKSYRDSEAKENKTKYPLAYVVYKDEKGKLRKETSWNSWRDQNRPPAEFDNIPMEGFKFLRTIQRTREWFGTGRNVWRILHPKGFQFEITSDNLEGIFHEIGIGKGGIITAKCVLGWQGTVLVLIPEGTEVYDEFMESSKRITAVKIKKADIKCGNTVTLKDGRKVIYYGKFYHLVASEIKEEKEKSSRRKNSKKIHYKWVTKEVVKPVDNLHGNVWNELEIKGNFEVVSIDDKNEIPREEANKVLNDWLNRMRKDHSYYVRDYTILSPTSAKFQIVKTPLSIDDISSIMRRNNSYEAIYFDYQGSILGLRYQNYGYQSNNPTFRYSTKLTLLDDNTYEVDYDHNLGNARPLTNSNEVMQLNPFKLEVEVPDFQEKQEISL